VVLLEVLVEGMGLLGVSLPSRYPLARTPHAEFTFPGLYFTFPEFETPVRLNGMAFHDTPRSPAPDEGVTRAALWGDSLFEGYQVERHHLTTQVLEAQLQAGGRSVEVLNLAYSGGRAATLQSPKALAELEALGVEVLLVELHSLMELGHAHAGGAPGFLPRAFEGFPEGRFAWIRRGLVNEGGLDGLFLVQDRARAIWRQRGRNESPDFFHRVRSVDAPGREVAWENMRRLFLALSQLESDRGIRVLLVYAPAWSEVQAERLGTVESLSPNRTPLDHGGVRRTMKAMAAEIGLPMVDISPAFIDPPGPTHYLSDRHWTPLGHARVAEAIHPALVRLLGSPTPPP